MAWGSWKIPGSESESDSDSELDSESGSVG